MESPEELFQKNIRLTYYFAKRWFPSVPEHYYEDIIAEASVGLWKACTTFNPQKGVHFATYASTIIYNQIGMFFRKNKKEFGHASLQQLLPGEEDITLEDVIGYEPNFDEDMDSQRIIKKVRKFRITSLMLQELTQTEIGNIIKCSQVHVSRLFKAEKKKLMKILQEAK